jgi:hypothetical protein
MNAWEKRVRKIRDLVALVVLLTIYHGYEVLCYFIGNLFEYYQAVGLFAVALFLGAAALIYLHDFFRRKYSWDALGLHYINSLRYDEAIPSYDLFKRLVRFVLRKGFWAIFVIGPILLGPFVITILLRRERTWKANLLFVLPGSVFNALFWVALMKGVGIFTWRYIG